MFRFDFRKTFKYLTGYLNDHTHQFWSLKDAARKDIKANVDNISIK